MDIVRTWAVFRKELIHIRRDLPSLIQVILLPVMLLLLNGYALTFDLTDVPLAVYDQEQSRVSQDFLQGFRGTRYFKIHSSVFSYDEIADLINSRQVKVALVLPFDFSRSLKTGQTARVQAIIDGTDANTANLIIGYLQSVTAAYSQQVILKRLHFKGFSRLELPIKSDPRIWFNEDLESRNFIVPGLIAIIMTMVGALLTALCIIREKERGSMEGLMGTPLKKWELILGKLGPYFLVGMLDMFIAMAMGEFLFQVPLRGSAWLFMVLAALFMLVVLGQGLLISVIARSTLDAYQMAMLTTFLPSFILSGAMFAIHQMPQALQVASYLVPATYLVTISKGIYLKGIGMKILWPDALMLCGFAAFFLLTAGRKLVKKIQ
ncbi:MAG: ABC transporter permease [Deltaproteobacteria bacterium]|nr:ABC transporter permease [Deltaproteobacteria bacterium]MBI4796891.1 ABC transporter permease [Deltaproteobacteria bacterium]